jgi:glycosyl transferase family 25
MNIPYLRLYYKWPARLSLLKPHFVEQSRSIVELSGPAFGTQGYLITQAGAKRLLDHCRVVRRPIDDEMDRSWVHGVRNLAIFPFPILEEAASSNIGGTRFETFSVPKHLRFKRLVTQRADRWRRRMANVFQSFRRLGAKLRGKT